MKRRLHKLLAPILLIAPVISPPAFGQGHSAAAMAERGRQAFRDGRASEAKASLAEAVRLSPRQPSYHAALAEVDLNLRDTQGAIHHFEIALKLDPSDIDVRSKLVQLYWSLNRDLDVIRILEVPDPEEPLRSIWRFSRALSLFRLGRLSAARHEFRTLVNRPDFEAPVSFFLGRIAYTQNQFGEALPFFAKAVRLGDSPANGEFIAYAYDYALTLFRLGRYSEAKTEFTRITERYATEPLPWMMRGRCEEELGNHSAAIDDYEQSIRIDPKLEVSYYHLARLHQRYGDKQRAEELFKQLGDLRQEEIQAQEDKVLKLQTEGSLVHKSQGDAISHPTDIPLR